MAAPWGGAMGTSFPVRKQEYEAGGAMYIWGDWADRREWSRGVVLHVWGR